MKKTKGSLISLLAFVAAAGFVPMPVLTAADDEATVQSSSVEVDWETVDWKEDYMKRHDQRDHSERCLSTEDAEIVWQRLQKTPQFHALPQVFKDLIEYGKAHYWHNPGKNTLPPDKEWGGVFFSSKKISIAFMTYSNIGLYVEIMKLKDVKFVDEPVETPAVNPKTKKPYVFPSNNTLRTLKGEDLAYVKAFTETVNRNIHYLGSSPVPRLDMKRVKQGAYIGMDFWTLSLVQPEAFYDSEKPRKKQYKKDINKTHDQLVEYFAKGDAETYRLQNVLGTPLYNPRAFAPEAERLGQDGRYFNCYGHPATEFLGVNVASLMFAAQAAEPKWTKWVLSFVYKQYFEAVLASCKLLTSGMESELSTLDKKSVRGRAVREVVTQASKYLEQIEEAAENCIAQSDEIYLNPPKTLLTSKVKGNAKSKDRSREKADSKSKSDAREKSDSRAKSKDRSREKTKDRSREKSRPDKSSRRQKNRSSK